MLKIRNFWMIIFCFAACQSLAAPVAFEFYGQVSAPSYTSSNGVEIPVNFSFSGGIITDVDEAEFQPQQKGFRDVIVTGAGSSNLNITPDEFVNFGNFALPTENFRFILRSNEFSDNMFSPDGLRFQFTLTNAINRPQNIVRPEGFFYGDFLK